MNRDLVCVVGLGYIGLPTAAMFASHGKKVIGVDVSTHVIDILRSGGVHIEEPELERMVRFAVNDGKLSPQLIPSKADVFIIAVPTPIQPDQSADLSYVHAAAESIVPFLQPGNLVILESTSPPGTTLGLVPLLEKSGLVVGTDIFLAHCPERVLPGRIMIELVDNDRVIGGQTPAAADEAADLYRTFVRGAIHLTDATTAEMAKLMENTFRDVNIALANEFARVAEIVGIDVHHAIRLANYHPRVDILRPGPGVGGHCIAVDPWFIVHSAPDTANLIRKAREINDAQPGYVVSMVVETLKDLDSPEIAVLGLSYKPNVDDVRESPSIEVVRALSKLNYRLRLHDVHAQKLPSDLELIDDLENAVEGVDLVLILTDHLAYHRLQPDSASLQKVRHRRIFDTRNCLDANAWRTGGWSVRQLGVANRAEARMSAIGVSV